MISDSLYFATYYDLRGNQHQTNPQPKEWLTETKLRVEESGNYEVGSWYEFKL